MWTSCLAARHHHQYPQPSTDSPNKRKWTNLQVNMISPSTNNLKCLQWNARGLTKTKLEEFYHYLSLVNPEVVLLSETHWNSSFAPKFKTHHILKKDRPNRLGGGVAILISKSLQFSPIHLYTPDTVEAIGASVLLKNNKQIDFISIYIPKADCETEDIENILNRSNPYVIGGHFNGHHTLWETNTNINKAGRSIYEALINDTNACLITTPNLTTRIDPASGKPSTIDLTITSPTISASASIKTGPYMGSDHLPLIITLNESVLHHANRPATWKVDDDKWTQWNKCIQDFLTSQKFENITDPEAKTKIFTDGIEKGNNQCFRKTNPARQPKTHKGPARPWWNEACLKAVKEARKFFREWKDSPLSLNKREAWKKAEAKKRRIILTAKKQAWSTFITSLGPNDQQRMWSFVKNMVGNGADPSAADRAIVADGTTLFTPQEKAELFVNRFSRVHPKDIANNSYFKTTIDRKIATYTKDPLNDPFTLEEIDKAIPNSKSKAVGNDLIQNIMIRNLIFSAELIAIHQALKIIYNREDTPPEIIVYSDSSAAIQAISTSTLAENDAVSSNREILSSLKSSGTRTTLAGIPSHTGIAGKEKADKLASTELTTQEGDRIENELSPKKKFPGTNFLNNNNNNRMETIPIEATAVTDLPCPSSTLMSALTPRKKYFKFIQGNSLLIDFIYNKIDQLFAFNLIMMPFSGSLPSFISLVDFGRHQLSFCLVFCKV
ncbi:hypothetical protein GHT06_018700 [Daphnia sinensis]|uniref:RNase H type-1 domain-containing protein n=1 Tax=Daphnia sinensis TaxID=1820382 RepID=A0AAD5PR22_9CRUS|nr:hypothetical protein GHT06_018700 [Daphnia sinensis]